MPNHLRIDPRILSIAFIAWLLTGPTLYGAEEPDQPSAEAARFFEIKVRPVLETKCVRCHGADKSKGDLRLDSRTAALAGGKKGPAIVPDRPESSLLIKAIRQSDELSMPPSGKLTNEQIGDLTRWIQMGAPWPKNAVVAVKRDHWAFQPVHRPAVPAVKDGAWAVSPIDAFILAALEAKGLQPNPPASKRELIRRLTYDLTGLPPTPNEVEAFEADRSPLAYETLVERLLQSPHYGEKWGRHWLDLVRYAETNSYERDGPKPNAWRFRDYVIRSFNDDKPYNRFARELLAGDELPDANLESIIATGYYRLGIWDDEPNDREQARYDALDDIVATTGQVFLGLTFDCARCHDHKFDPIPQKDYYRLVSFFQNINHFHNGGPTDEIPLFAEESRRREYADQLRAVERRRGELEAALKKVRDTFRALLAAPPAGDADLAKRLATDGERVLGKEAFDHYQELQRELASLKPPSAEMALCVTEAGTKAPDTFVLLRGNAHAPGDRVEPLFPSLFKAAAPQVPPPAAGAKTTGRRLALANWIASADNPLTARVLTNRIWQHHFGRGIVRSASNFGLQGDLPTHPELLDWLTAEFVQRGWHIKELHRLIVTSNAYRMSSQSNAQSLAADQANDLYWRFDSRRLTAEEIRDSILSVTGTLNPKMYGPSIYPVVPKEVLAGLSMPDKGWGKSTPEEQTRRSIYIHVKRSLLTPILERFDLAETDRSTPVRFATTQPTQALAMLNSAFLQEQSARLAVRLKNECGDETAKQVELALRLATQRPPEAREVRRGVALIEAFRGQGGVAAERSLQYFCLMVLNLNEFVYLD